MKASRVVVFGALVLALASPGAVREAGADCSICCFDYRSPMIRQTSSLAGASGGRAVDTDCRYLYIANNSRALQICDLVAPATPTPIGSHMLAGDPYAIVVDDDRYAYVLTVNQHPTSRTYRLEIVDARDPRAPHAVSTVVLPSTNRVIALDGAHRMSWDGQNDSGVSVASGVYLYRVEAGSLVARGRLVRIR